MKEARHKKYILYDSINMILEKTNLIYNDRKAGVGVGGLTGPIPSRLTFLPPPVPSAQHRTHHCTFLSFSDT